jgi:O-methyltransferase
MRKSICKLIFIIAILFSCKTINQVQKVNITDKYYLDLMKGIMINEYQIQNTDGYNVQDRIKGIGHNPNAYTMLSLKQLDFIENCVKDILKNNISGDFIECGVWRGGATIFMKSLLKAYNDTVRKVWVSDSFEGCPKPNINKYPDDANSNWFENPDIAVSLEQVKINFSKFDLLDNNVIFLKGWFKNTLPGSIERLSLLRVDGDLYESTMDAISLLYDKLSIGGYFIDDDYGSIPQAKKAIDDFRKKHNITEEIKTIDFTGVYWKKCNN